MIVTGELTVPAPRAEVFTALQDAEFFASCIEGVCDVEALDDRRYRAKLVTRIAYIRFKFKVTVELTAVEPVERIEAKVEGVPMGMVGRLSGTSEAVLEERGLDTVITYTIKMALTGKLGSIGQPVLKAKAREMERGFARKLLAAFTQEEAAENAEAQP